MCRFVGFLDVSYRNDYDIEAVITKMRDAMVHGGPDDAGNFVDKNLGLAIGHRRLSILDLSERAKQPMKWQDYIIVYNGEIYNFREIRMELEKKGYSFFSNSDTEVILKSFVEWGYEMVHKFRGMWAFAIWDREENKLILCRDRIGVKPLYWYFKDGLFMFSSEIKAFHMHPRFRKELDFEALSLYFQYGYIPAPYSTFKYVRKLQQGCYLELKLKENSINIDEIPYWEIESEYEEAIKKRKEMEKLGEREIVCELESVLVNSFKLRMVSDVPVGIFLSGGIDSTTVTTLLQKEHSKPLKTFTIGFYEDDYNEAGWAKKVADCLGTDHHELYLTPKEAFDIIYKLPWIYDEPFGDPSGIPTYLVSQFAKEHVKVALSADGGDEFFYGYNRYWTLNSYVYHFNKLPKHFKAGIYFVFKIINPNLIEEAYNKLNFLFPTIRNLKGKIIRLKDIMQDDSFIEQYDASIRLIPSMDVFSLGLKTNKRLKDIVFDEIVPDNLCDFVMLFDAKSYLPNDILVKVDRATMSVSLEGREPFLDNKIVELALAIPPTLKWNKGRSKWILREILYRYIPKELIERPKQGFGIPIYKWFKNDLKSLYLEYLNPDRIKREGILNYKALDKWLENYFNDREQNQWKLWLPFVFEMWLERWKII